MQIGLYNKPKFRLAGDRGLLVEYGDGISLPVNNKVRAMAMLLEQRFPDGITEIIPTYRSLLLIYDPMTTNPDALKGTITELEERIEEITIPPSKIVEIPVCYGDDLGPDIGFVAESHGLSIDEVITIHTSSDYPIYMIGFTPGFCFLGGLSENLHTPRLETPRTVVPEGSVGIANAQTGMYPVQSPGGWRLIGRTPLKLFAPERKDPFLYRTGDLIRFIPINRNEYDKIVIER